MPVKSRAQMRKFFELLAKKKISRQKFEEWTGGVNVSELPEKIGRNPIGFRRFKRMKKP